MSDKPMKAKPNLYAVYFEPLKAIALKYGYNLVIHGSLNRDMDLVAIPWQEELKPHYEMVAEMTSYLGGWIEAQETWNKFYSLSVTYHGRMHYIINLNRGGKRTNYEDPQYYIDLSVMPTADRIPPWEIVLEWTMEEQKRFLDIKLERIQP